MNEQDSSIYPHLYVANTIDLPQEYFTGGFLQQDPVSHLERPEEYVPQLSNMEDHYQQQPSSSTHVPPTAVTGNEHSDGGEEVQSPVAPTDTRDNNRKGSVGKRRKRASSRSSSSSSERSSSPLRSGSDGRKKTKERRSRSKRRSQPPSRSPTATRPRESPEKRGNPTPTRPQHPPIRPQHPQKRHAVTKGLNNDLFESMRHKMPESASRAASLVSEISSVSTSKRRSPVPFVLGDFVPKHLQGKEVCTKTICAIQTLRNVKRRDRIEAVRLIVHVAP
ncbi:hypothetical protein J6590_070740 [Homalodisca vitripennis]|nr:hypothetical protein J6590_070740 [Homalodisca vitripennis]